MCDSFTRKAMDLALGAAYGRGDMRSGYTPQLDVIAACLLAYARGNPCDAQNAGLRVLHTLRQIVAEESDEVFDDDDTDQSDLVTSRQLEELGEGGQ